MIFNNTIFKNLEKIQFFIKKQNIDNILYIRYWKICILEIIIYIH